MATDLKRLKQHFKAYEPTLKELKRKYQVRAPDKRQATAMASTNYVNIMLFATIQQCAA